MGARIVAVVAMGRNRELGKDGKLLWHIPDDLKRFKRLTQGHPVIMGRKTFESIVKYIGHALPERPNIVVTRAARYADMNPLLGKPGFNESKYGAANVFVVESLEAAFKKANEFNSDEIHIGGGAEIYKQALPLIDKLYLTLIDASAAADSFFPPYEDQFTKKTFDEKHEWNGLKYRWVDLERA